ncbi:MAG: tannase/feruloyl esterase family alpha/beta hydrolase, partial [Novosphingobium sp.]|nr:tannase/feruloyl esterase family alpha/beta hydrolase [Novosphingobium sp.]
MRIGDGQIDLAQSIPANQNVPNARLPDMYGTPGGGPEVSGLPEICRVAGTLRPEAGSDIRFEVWLPANTWNGRFFGVGNGGFAGSLSYMEMAQAVRGGNAVATTDTGHSGGATDSEWARDNPAKVRDYGWRAVHLTTVAAKSIAAAYYGEVPRNSYFMACSNGGRQALMEASRFPADYDGIIAGAPASDFAALITSMIATQHALSKDGAGLKLSQLDFIQSSVLTQCDALDGQLDRLVDDPRRCKLDFDRLSCSNSDSSECLSEQQVSALKA